MSLFGVWDEFCDKFEIELQTSKENVHNMKFGFMGGAQSVLNIIADTPLNVDLPDSLKDLLEGISTDIQQYISEQAALHGCIDSGTNSLQ